MDRIIRRSRLALAAAALTASVGLLTGCSRADVGEVYAFECERRTVHASTATSLADALAQQAAVNKAYRQCIDRKGVRASN